MIRLTSPPHVTARPRQRRRQWALVTTAVLSLAVLAGRADGAQRLDPARAAQEYLAAADAYATGAIENAVVRAVGWDREFIDAAVESLARTPAVWTDRRAMAALMLHAEAVISQAVLPSRLDAHLRAGRRIADTPAGMRLPRAFRHDWLLAVSWHLLTELEFARTVPWLSALLERESNDGEGVATLATFAEVYAWTPEPPAPLPWDHPLLRQMSGPNRGRVLDFAIRTYRRALDIAPSEAVRLRHARSLLAAERIGEAVPLLQRLHESAADRDVRYLAALFLAAAHQRRARYAEAADAYQGAIALKPGCQTAVVGLGAVLALQGRATEAARVAAQLETEAVPCEDPWWGYRFGPPLAQRAQLLLQLRRTVVGR